MAQTKVATREKDTRTTKDNRKTGNVRNRRIDRLTVAALVAVVVLAGAVVWQATHHGRNSATPSRGSNTSSPTVSPSYHVPESAFASQPAFTGPAVTKYGQSALQKAYRQMVDFAFNAGWDVTLMAKTRAELSSRDFAAVRLSLTPTCAKAFDANMTKALANDPAAIRELEGSMFFAVGGIDPNGAADRTPVVTNRAFTRAQFTVDTTHGQRLSMTFTTKAVVHTQDASGKNFTVQTGRALHYILVPNTRADANLRPFLIDAWGSRMQSQKPKPA
jgi:hypothetical protein